MTKIYNKIYQHLDLSLETLVFEKQIYDANEFIILLSDQKTKIINIIFDRTVIFYRGTDENSLGSEIYDSKGLEGWCLYEVTNSQLISDYNKLSDGFYEDYESNRMEKRHFAIYTEDLCLDIIATDEPLIEIEEYSQENLNFF
jgi:hypothetical protein